MIAMIKLCLEGLKEKKGRTTLVSLSIAIGVFSILIISIISDNGIILINDELDSLGISGVSISRPTAEFSEQFTNDELEKIKQIEYVENATPIVTSYGYLKNDENNKSLVCGIDENAKSVISLEVVSGQKINKTDIISNNKVCLIDQDTAEKMFSNKMALGKKINVFIGGSSEEYTVIGLVEASSSILQTSVGDLLPTIIYVPYTTLQYQLGTTKIEQIAVNFTSNSNTDFYINRLENILNDKDLYASKLQIEDLNKQRDSLNGILNIVSTVMKLIGVVSLIVSGLGIMTIMLVSVSEKTKEIGIKKSIGATKGDIAFEFLFESLIISVIGCVIGIIILFLILGVGFLFFNLNISINISTIFITILIALLCGIIFGVYPATKASKLNPIDALRNE